MPILDNFRFCLGNKEYLPLVAGGMGVDISTSELALEMARLGAIGHISDAMSPWVSDRKFKTRYQSTKQKKHRQYSNSFDKSQVKWDLQDLYDATYRHANSTMEQKQGSGAIWVNVMEKLTMGAPRETLQTRLNAVLDAGIDGVTLSAGLHCGTLGLIVDNPRFRDANIGIIVSSARALKLFLRSAKRVDRYPNYIIVEGPLAGGHLGFGEDWKQHNLRAIVIEVVQMLKEADLDIPVLPAGGVFTGTDAQDFIALGASAIQVATRFTISQECGLPPLVKQKYLRANEEDVVVNSISPTGYLMRMLRNSPCLQSNVKPNCEALGYILNKNGECQYHDAYQATPCDSSGKKLPVTDKMCICYHFMKFQCYTCGHNVYRLKDTTYKLSSGEFYLPRAEDIFNDYLYSPDHEIRPPSPVDTSTTTPEIVHISNGSKNGTNRTIGTKGEASLQSAAEYFRYSRP